MPPRPCLVSVTDVAGIRHSVQVEAATLYEAAALGLQVFRANGWVEAIGGTTALEVEVREPRVKHTVTVRQNQRWSESVTVSPAEKIRKDRVKGMLASRFSDRGILARSVF